MSEEVVSTKELVEQRYREAVATYGAEAVDGVALSVDLYNRFCREVVALNKLNPNKCSSLDRDTILLEVGSALVPVVEVMVLQDMTISILVTGVPQ